MPFDVNDAGVWKAPNTWHVNDGGVWKTVKQLFVNDAGVWKPLLATSVARDGVAFDPGEQMAVTMPSVGSPTDARRYTLSLWLQRDGTAPFGFHYVWEEINQSNQLVISDTGEVNVLVGGGSSGSVTTAALPFSTTGVPHHIMVSFDSTQAVAADRLRLWIDAVEVTAFSNDQRSGIALNDSNAAVANSAVQTVSSTKFNNQVALDGTVADIYFVDGLAIVDPGEFTTGPGSGLAPKAASVALGNRGWHLDFANPADLGNDAGPNALDFTLTGIDAADHVSPFL